MVPGQPQNRQKDSGDRQRHRRPGQRDQQLLAGLIGNPFEAGYAADGKENDVRGAHPEASGHQDVPELVQEDASEEGEQRERAGQRRLWPALRIADQRPPAYDQQEGDVHLDGGACDPPDRVRPTHLLASRSASRKIA